LYQVDIDIVRLVTGLHADRDDPSVAIMAKDVTHEDVYGKYGTYKGSRGVVIAEITDHIV
jgi:hypothetical protein